MNGNRAKSTGQGNFRDYRRGGGVYIHIGAKGHTAKTLRNLANIMASHEQLLIDALNLDEVRIRRYCKTVDPRFLEQVNRTKTETMSQLADVWYRSHNANYGRNQHYNDSRYHMLKLHATFTKGTVNSDFSNLMHLQTANRTDFTQNS